MNNGTNKFLVGALIVLVLFSCGQSYFTYKLYQDANNEDAVTSNSPEMQRKNGVPGSFIDNNPWGLFRNNDQGNDSWSPFDEMQRMHDEMNRMFGRTFSRFSRDPNFEQLLDKSTFEPRIDISDEGDRYLVIVDVPGVEDSTIDVSVENAQLRISGRTERRRDKENSAGAMVHRERYFGSFERTIQLPEDVDQAGIKQEYKDGVLRITLPKIIT
jgi:HSP20 family protein